MYMKTEDYNIKFTDSINFTLIPLRDFPKTFGLTELAKGYFPHLFNTVENQNYIGKYPHEDYYGYQSMTIKQRETFMEWYETVKDEIFDFRKEIMKYCDSDVDILRRGCLEIRKLFLKIADIDPFRYVTVAGVCMAIYRSKFLKEGTIAIDEDIKQDVYSKKSIAWLDYLSDKHNINIQHALNGGEKKLRLGNKTYKVDGFYENTVYQFQGCHWHGCLRCNRESTINKQNQICMKDLYEKTQKINKKILDAGYELFQIWECDFDNDKEIKKYIKKEWKREFVTPLNPRDAFYGGRCEPTTLNKKWYGLIKCKVLPPRKLYHPVLPYKKEKLVFSLCKSCSKTIKCKHKNEVGKPKSAVEKKKCKECYEIRNKECNHTDEERSFIGTWTTTEVKLAIQKGYEILNVYEVWNFNSKSKDLFRDYVKMFLKIKLETDDKWNFKTEEEYRRYVKEKLDIELGKIEKNPGLRFIAKICLNSLWGKFEQRKNMQQTEYVMELEDFYRIVLNDAIKDLNMIFLNDDCVEMQYKMKDEYAKDNFNTNVYVAAFTTSSARIRLYEIMDKLIEY
ncbi:DNA_pol_B_2 domain-containing protein [Trichonephila clavipes]|nr:DNA_pol_B_2 domain-containing protein [Trichonephila clavipes]